MTYHGRILREDNQVHTRQSHFDTLHNLAKFIGIGQHPPGERLNAAGGDAVSQEVQLGLAKLALLCVGRQPREVLQALVSSMEKTLRKEKEEKVEDMTNQTRRRRTTTRAS